MKLDKTSFGAIAIGATLFTLAMAAYADARPDQGLFVGAAALGLVGAIAGFVGWVTTPGGLWTVVRRREYDPSGRQTDERYNVVSPDGICVSSHGDADEAYHEAERMSRKVREDSTTWASFKDGRLHRWNYPGKR